MNCVGLPFYNIAPINRGSTLIPSSAELIIDAPINRGSTLIPSSAGLIISAPINCGAILIPSSAGLIIDTPINRSSTLIPGSAGLIIIATINCGSTLIPSSAGLIPEWTALGFNRALSPQSIAVVAASLQFSLIPPQFQMGARTLSNGRTV